MKTKRTYLIVVSSDCDVKDYGKNWIAVWNVSHAMQHVQSTKNLANFLEVNEDEVREELITSI
jgi:hypothetical protein